MLKKQKNKKQVQQANELFNASKEEGEEKEKKRGEKQLRLWLDL